MIAIVIINRLLLSYIHYFFTREFLKRSQNAFVSSVYIIDFQTSA